MIRTINSIDKKIVRFVSWSYGIAWLLWLPGILSTYGIIREIVWLPFFAAGTCAPLFAALICMKKDGGFIEIKNRLAAGFSERVFLKWWILIISIPFAIPAAGFLIDKHFEAGAVLDILAGKQNMLIGIVILMVTIGGGQEEFGWRWYLLPLLDKRANRVMSDIFLVVIHTLWHLPLFFISFTMQYRYPFWVFVIFGAGFTLLANHINRNTGYSILSAVLFHGFVNSGLEIFPVVDPAAGNSYSLFLTDAVLYLIVFFIAAAVSKKT